MQASSGRFLAASWIAATYLFSFPPGKENATNPSCSAKVHSIIKAPVQTGQVLLCYLQQTNTSLLAGLNSTLIPNAGLNFTDMTAAHHQHSQSALTDTAADGERQFAV